ncbi:MAG: hypothetical protein JSR61_12305 [Proteobacteria bacterium]|nr:hypothetical protein [Pseudomonadota bacterium]
MTVIQQVVTPEVRDPNDVIETLANGPINMNGMGNYVTLTFTQMRPDIGQLFKGKVDVNKLTAVVVARVTMPVENLIQMKAMLDHSVVNVVPNGVNAMPNGGVPTKQ